MSFTAATGEDKAGAKQQEPARVLNETGSTVMAVNTIHREGDRLVINGTLMGAWPSDMYVEPEDVARLIGRVLSWPIIGLVLSLPYIRWRDRRNKASRR